MRALLLLVIACGTTAQPAAKRFAQATPGIGATLLEAGVKPPIDAGFAQSIDAAVIPNAAARVYPKIALDGNPQTDIASPPCQPGTICLTGVTLPLGARVAGMIEVDAPQAFQNVVWSTSTTTDGAGTWLSVSGLNTSQSAARLTGMLEWQAP